MTVYKLHAALELTIDIKINKKEITSKRSPCRNGINHEVNFLVNTMMQWAANEI